MVELYLSPQNYLVFITVKNFAEIFLKVQTNYSNHFSSSIPFWTFKELKQIREKWCALLSFHLILSQHRQTISNLSRRKQVKHVSRPTQWVLREVNLLPCHELCLPQSALGHYHNGIIITDSGIIHTNLLRTFLTTNSNYLDVNLANWLITANKLYR